MGSPAPHAFPRARTVPKCARTRAHIRTYAHMRMHTRTSAHTRMRAYITYTHIYTRAHTLTSAGVQAQARATWNRGREEKENSKNLPAGPWPQRCGIPGGQCRLGRGPTAMIAIDNPPLPICYGWSAARSGSAGSSRDSQVLAGYSIPALLPVLICAASGFNYFTVCCHPAAAVGAGLRYCCRILCGLDPFGLAAAAASPGA